MHQNGIKEQWLLFYFPSASIRKRASVCCEVPEANQQHYTQKEKNTHKKDFAVLFVCFVLFGPCFYDD